MGRKPTIVELILSVTLLIVGLYILYEGSSNKSANADAMVVGGSVCLTLGAMMFLFAGKSLLALRRMVRHTLPNRDSDTTALEHKPSR
jgi:hypothetical protein